ncbi:GNAT family N-acetyltransferase [Cellulomonas carbonis]|uniref:GCN5 family acetyltransferase n=1 Tax=Cellulomonas carbonis T26 TaxID=947969 RepID=A0A0A0BMT7_9CELL|nr:GNAT family N-acetyltransferase [Cellulomonas carbonis]KGM09027.1 GCN5 family acetyltransferase [Cellulomonas carbonis T26]GGC17376.1 hypothetical protein GCM10010972_33290 [Cellulomonas carbonis]
MAVVLRRWTTADGGDLAGAVVESPDLARQLGGADVTAADSGAAFVAEHLEPWGPRTFQLAITVDGRAVGNIGLSHVEHVHDTAWVSYWLRASVRGRGLATRALASVSRWAFDELDLHRLELAHRTNNPASCRVAHAAGFAAEGVERAKLRYGSERFDVETHARLRTDPVPDVDALDVLPLVAQPAR